jgi:hypothetical protein
MTEHRVPMRRSGWPRYPDPATSPRFGGLVVALHRLEFAPPPPSHFRAELRSQLVAVAPRLITESAESLASLARGPAGHRAVRRARGWRRPLALVTGTLVLLAFLLGGAVWMSQRALPGDALYGLKRAGESLDFDFTSGDTARSRLLLSFATTRADEVSALLGRDTAMALGVGPQAGGAVNSRTAALVRSTLDSANSDVHHAAQLLGAQAVRQHSAAPLQIMTAWAPGQLGRLRAIAARIPTGSSLHHTALASDSIVTTALRRARQLAANSGCSCLSTAPIDGYGPRPCGTPCGPAVTPSPSPTTPPASPSAVRPSSSHHHPAPRRSRRSHRAAPPPTTPQPTPPPSPRTPISSPAAHRSPTTHASRSPSTHPPTSHPPTSHSRAPASPVDVCDYRSVLRPGGRLRPCTVPSLPWNLP